MHAFRREGKSEPRILYWFRTPPFVKVGRTALDEEAIRLLEERHPDVPFDWNRILREPPQPMSRVEAEKRREAREAREARRRKRSRREEREQIEQAVAERAEPEPFEPGPLELEAVELEALEPEPKEPKEPKEPEEPEEPGLPPSHPLLELVGPEGFTRLRARHASLMARIAEVPDEVRREALRLESERLNPDLWVTLDEARAALESYEASYEALRSQLGRKRRRRRRRPRGEKPV